MQSIPRVALVGRPNVGKSTLFNRLLGKRQAVVAPVAGTTRDRLQEELEVNGIRFLLVDMAGLEPTLHDDTEISQGTQAQVEQALASADLLLWVVDIREGVSQADQQIAVLLRSLYKPVVVVANKSDDPKHELGQYDFASFGFEELVPISAMHGRGISELLEAVLRHLPETGGLSAEPPDEKELRVAIAGRPNVGKSTLLNTLLKEERAVVSAVAGTTRDAVDSLIPAENLFFNTFTKWRTVRIIDTAGIRRRGKIGHEVEAWSVVRTFDAIDRAEVVLFMLDAQEGLVHQDMQVAQQIVNSGRAFVLLINKWDAVLAKKKVIAGTPEDEAEQARFLDTLRQEAPFLHWVQVVFISAQNQLNIHVIGRVVLNAYIAWSRQLPQDELDELAAQLRSQPVLRNLQKITQEHAQPPVFHVQVEGRSLPHFSTLRSIENALRDAFELGPTPVKIWAVPSLGRRAHKK